MQKENTSPKAKLGRFGIQQGNNNAAWNHLLFDPSLFSIEKPDPKTNFGFESEKSLFKSDYPRTNSKFQHGGYSPDQLIAMINKQNDTLELYQLEIDKRNAQIKELEKQLIDQKTKMFVLHTSLTEVQQEKTRICNEYEERCEKFKIQLEDCKTVSSNLKAAKIEIDKYKVTNAKQVSELNKQKQTIASLKNEQKTLKTQIQDMKGQNEGLSEEISNLQAALNAKSTVEKQAHVSDKEIENLRTTKRHLEELLTEKDQLLRIKEEKMNKLSELYRKSLETNEKAREEKENEAIKQRANDTLHAQVKSLENIIQSLTRQLISS
jgi:chromosome segregation ATPase